MSNTINYKNVLIVLVLLTIMVGILLNPEMSMNSAKEGLYIWLNILLPSLFPFIFISNLLISFGFVKFLGRFLEPLMKPIFKVSGTGIFPFIISTISGYPVGAKLSSNLRNKKLISQLEGNRLISFSSTSGPLFIMGTVMIAMLRINAAPLFILPHYLGVITVGFIFRFYEGGKSEKIAPKKYNQNKYQKTLGRSMGDAVKDSMESMLVVGGYVIVFTVVINLALESQALNFFLQEISLTFKINPEILKGLIAGIIELTNGCNIVSNLDISLIEKILIINFLIGWGGFSINSQAISFISQTDLNVGIYMVSKVFHGIFSVIYTYIIYTFFYKDKLLTVFYNLNLDYISPSISTWLSLFKSSFSIVSSAIVLLILLSIFLHEMKKRT